MCSTTQTMKLKKLLDLHNQTNSDYALTENLGDSYLMTHNSIYREIRKLTIGNGFTFTTQVNPNYTVLPLSQLDVFLEKKKIPFFDNVSILWEIEKKTPQMNTWDDLIDGLKQNHLFHESCHGLARSVSTRCVTKNLSEEEIILRLLIEESFANACELIGNMDVDTPAHRIFYESNSYIYVYQERTQLKSLISEFGIEESLRFFIFCYLHSNYLRENISDSDLEIILKNPKINRNRKLLKSLSKIAFRLNPRFRHVTTVFYLRLCGYNVTTEDLIKTDFIRILNANSSLTRLIDELVSQFN